MPGQTSTVALPSPALDIMPLRAEVWAREVAMHGGTADTVLARCRVTSDVVDMPARVEGSRWSARVPLAEGTNSVAVTCHDDAGREHRSATARLHGMLRQSRLGPERPTIGPAARDAVVYGVIPPLYGAPPLRAVREALPELAELGVDILWLSPTFENAPRDYGYAVTDYLRVRPDYGTHDDLTELVASAHRHDMRIVLDFVPNHTSIHHRYFQEARDMGRASHYWSFYLRDPDGAPTHYFDWSHLPNLDYRNAEVARWMTEAGRRWLEDTGIDGYRIDVAWAIQDRSPSFFDAFRREIRAIDPRALLFAEASARDPYWLEHGFDAAYDWTDTPGEWSWNAVFHPADGIPDRLDAAVRASPSSTMRFLENNDTGTRFLTKHGVGMTRVASAALLTLPGIPALFTGQERGAEYEPYARETPLDREDLHQLRDHYRALIAVRRALPALRSDEYARLELTERDDRVLAFRRGSGAAPGETAIVALRFDSTTARARVRLPEALKVIRNWKDTFSGQTLTASDGVLSVELASWGARVLVPMPKAGAAQAARKSPRD
ncbi:MAG: hypothetical protein BGO98_36350 [Myxococcales bacterium 68-20]|nr:MAG: hypothetical protein BGO98_36350 [Myxococcales bacterium 68-20]